MSMRLMVSAMKARVGNAGRKLVLLKLADHANDAGECWPSYQFIADDCEMGRSTVKSHIKALMRDGFITVVARNDGKSSNQYMLHLEAGKAKEKKDTVKIKPGQNLTRSESNPVKSQQTRSESDPLTRSESDPRTYHSSEPVKEPDNPDGLSSSGKSLPDVHPDDRRLAEFIFAGVVDAAPRTKPPNFDKWADTIRLMRERDGLTRREIAEVFTWANRDSFWRLNILSPSTLRDKFAQLSARREQTDANSNRPGIKNPSVTDESTVGRAAAAADRKRQEILARHGSGPGAGDGGPVAAHGRVIRGEVAEAVR